MYITESFDTISQLYKGSYEKHDTALLNHCEEKFQ